MGVFSPCRIAACRAADPREGPAPGVDALAGGTLFLAIGVAACAVFVGVIDDDDDDSVRIDWRTWGGIEDIGFGRTVSALVTEVLLAAVGLFDVELEPALFAWCANSGLR